jgi:transcription initiation factor TFIIB
VGAPASLARPDQGLTTTVGGAGDTLKLSPTARNKAKTMKIWQNRINTASERNLRIPLGELNHAIESLQLPNVVREEAAKIYREAASKRLVRGRSMNSVIAGAIYAAARRFNYAITLDEIAETLSTNKKEVGKAYRLLTKALNIRILPPSPKDYIYKYANALGVSNKTLKDALALLDEANRKGLISGKGPMGVAAAILYIACTLNKEKKTQRDVAKVANITEVTIRNRFKELYDKLVPQSKGSSSQ